MKKWCILAVSLGFLWACRELADTNAAEPMGDAVEASAEAPSQNGAFPPDTGRNASPAPLEQTEDTTSPLPLRAVAQDTGSNVGPEQSPIPAQEAARDQLMAAARNVEQIQAEVEARATALLLFARVDMDSLVPVADSDSWPAATEVSYILLPDSLGRVRYLQEVPVSQSGDWHNTYTHYFAEDGRTLSFERYSGFFNGCRWGLAKEWTESVFGEAGQVLERTYRLEDVNGKAHDPSECEEFYHRYPYEVFPSWGAAAQELGLPKHPNNGG